MTHITWPKRWESTGAHVRVRWSHWVALDRSAQFRSFEGPCQSSGRTWLQSPPPRRGSPENQLYRRCCRHRWDRCSSVPTGDVDFPVGQEVWQRQRRVSVWHLKRGKIRDEYFVYCEKRKWKLACLSLSQQRHRVDVQIENANFARLYDGFNGGKGSAVVVLLILAVLHKAT